MASRFGAYGKIPSLGDFFRHDLAADFVTAWDSWLQQAMTAARSVMQGAWTDRYMSAPIWRFAVAPGLVGREGAMGVMMPSVDRVGRQFPLTLAAPVASDGPPLRLLAAQDRVLADLEHLALDMLDDAMTRDHLVARLAELQPTEEPAPSIVRNSGGGFVVAGGSERLMLSDLVLHYSPAPAAVFEAAVDGQARLLASPSLPGGAGAAALFDLGAAFWTGAEP